MHGNLASIRETVALAATEALDAALTFLISLEYRTTERTATSLTMARSDRSDPDDGDQPHVTVLAVPQHEGGVQVTVTGNDRDGVHERQVEWADWANSLPKRVPNRVVTEQATQEEPGTPLPAPLPASKSEVAPQRTVEVPKTEPARQVIVDRPDQLEKIRLGLLPGEEIEAVLDLKGSGSGFMGITSKRIIFQDNAWVTSRLVYTRLSYSPECVEWKFSEVPWQRLRPGCSPAARINSV